MNDPVSKPNHYMLFADGTEAIDVIIKTLTPEEFIGYCKGNVLKYRLRAGKKDALEQDIAKANTYARMLDEQLNPAKEVKLDFTAKPLYEKPEKPGAFHIVPKGYYKKPETFGVLISESEHAYSLNEDECNDCATCMNLNCPRR